MRTFPMKRMPVVVRSTSQGAAVLDMNLPDEAFGDDGLPRNGYVIPNKVRCWIEIDDMGPASRQAVAFGDLDLA